MGPHAASLRVLSALYFDNDEEYGGSDLLLRQGYGSVSDKPDIGCLTRSVLKRHMAST